jgi:hypothetical protein
MLMRVARGRPCRPQQLFSAAPALVPSTSPTSLDSAIVSALSGSWHLGSLLVSAPTTPALDGHAQRGRCGAGD